jgi:pantetheine-phosphate adenylyltransferase
MKRFKLAATGGTFDRLHYGHKALLRKAFDNAERVLIGITTDSMVRKRKQWAKVAERFEERKRNLEAFLKKQGWLARAKVIALHNEIGPTLSKKGPDCIVTSFKTIAGTKRINALRRRKRLKQLPVILAKLVRSEDTKPISSTRVRAGETNRKGRVYSRLLKKTATLTSERLRKMLKKPFGTLTRNHVIQKIRALKPTKIIAIGDRTSRDLEKIADILVADGFVERTPVSLRFHAPIVLKARNAAGTVSRNLDNAMRKAIHAKKRVLVKVKGEEDLAVLPAVLVAPLNSVIAYGQPGDGAVIVRVTEKVKEKAARIMKALETTSKRV